MKFEYLTNSIRVLDENNVEMGHISWTIRKDGVYEANHTYVNPQFRGMGIANILLDKLVEKARSENFKIKAVCSFVVKMFEKSPNDYLDIIY